MFNFTLHALQTLYMYVKCMYNSESFLCLGNSQIEWSLGNFNCTGCFTKLAGPSRSQRCAENSRILKSVWSLSLDGSKWSDLELKSYGYVLFPSKWKRFGTWYAGKQWWIMYLIFWVVVSKRFYFHPYLGRWIYFDEYVSNGLKPRTSYLLKVNVFLFWWFDP